MRGSKILFYDSVELPFLQTKLALHYFLGYVYVKYPPHVAGVDEAGQGEKRGIQTLKFQEKRQLLSFFLKGFGKKVVNWGRRHKRMPVWRSKGHICKWHTVVAKEGDVERDIEGGT